MADTPPLPAPGGELVAFLGVPEVAAPRGDAPEAVRARIERLQRRFAYAWAHPLWRRWREEAVEDLAFVTGTGQWDAETVEKLRQQDRAVLTINEIRPVVEVLVGYERASRLEIKPIPEGEEDLENVSVLGRLLKRVMHDSDGDFILSDGFKEGVITGLAVWKADLDYDQDTIHGVPVLVPCKLGEVLWDPDAMAYDLRDARDVFWHKMVPLDELIAQYPEREADLRDALDALGTGDPTGAPLAVEHADAKDRYASSEGPGGLPFYDEAREEVRVLEAWYRDWMTVHLLVDTRANTVEELDDEPTILGAARALAAADAAIKVVARRRRKIEMCVLLPALGIELEHGNPFENDTEAYPFVPFVAYREGQELLGIVRNLKDPQREVNKRRSALADNVSRFGNLRWFAHRGSLENPEDLEKGRGAGYVYWLRSGTHPAPQAIPPPPMPEWVWRMQEIAKTEIREISGVNADLLGARGEDSSGIAIARRQQQGQVIATPLFDNYKRSRRAIGKRLVKRIQQSFTAERTIRLDAGAAGSDFVQLNARTIDPETGHVTILNNIPDVAYDVVIADAPSTPSARQAALAALLEILQRVPAAAPVLLDEVIKLTDLPDQATVLARVRGWMAQQGLLPGTAAPGAPRSGPPGAAAPGGRPDATTGAHPRRRRARRPLGRHRRRRAGRPRGRPSRVLAHGATPEPVLEEER